MNQCTIAKCKDKPIHKLKMETGEYDYCERHWLLCIIRTGFVGSPQKEINEANKILREKYGYNY